MKNFLKTVFSAMKTWVDIKIKDSTADWNQNDSSATNYVKNKPFYEKEGIVYKLDKKYLPEECATLEQVEILQAAVEDAQDTAYEAQNTAETAQSTAETAQSTAKTAQSTADSKMDKTNPTGTGSFSMNRQNDSAVGKNSIAIGPGTVAPNRNLFVSGKYNKYNENVYNYYRKATVYSTLSYNQSYFSDSFEFDAIAGKFSLVNPKLGYASNNVGKFTFRSSNINTTNSEIYYITERIDSYNFKYATYGITPMTNENSDYIHIVGNGAADTHRSNAHTLDWDGNAWYQGEVYVGGTAQDDENAVKLAKVTDIPEVVEQWLIENPIQAEVPEALPNPNKLTFTGAVTAEYDGSEEVAIEIPEIPEIPESIPIPETAEVGQTIVVKAVDENGKPTEWEAADIEKKTKLITVLDVTLEQDTILSHDDTNDLSFGDAVIAGGHYFYKTPEGNQLKAKRIYGYIQPPSELKLPTNLGISPYYADGTPNGWSFGDFLGNYVGIIGLCDGNITIAANNYFTFAVSHDLKIAYSGAGGSLAWLTASNRKMAYKTMDATFPYFSGVKIAVGYGSFTIPAGTKIVIKAEVEDDA